jgi:hypothetical protein
MNDHTEVGRESFWTHRIQNKLVQFVFHELKDKVRIYVVYMWVSFRIGSIDYLTSI